MKTRFALLLVSLVTLSLPGGTAKAAACDPDGKVKFIDWPEDRKMIEIGDAVISNQKIKSLLNWAPRYDLNGGLSKTRDYFADCLNEYLE